VQGASTTTRRKNTLAASLFDSPYYADQFSTPAMRAVFSDEARFAAWLAFEAALARAEAETGVIPA
jgi:3-carboxy-cis,cis-muconate cycloisomerase